MDESHAMTAARAPGPGQGEEQFAVILGATSIVGRYLARRLADGGFEGWCVSRHADPPPYEPPPGFRWRDLTGDTIATRSRPLDLVFPHPDSRPVGARGRHPGGRAVSRAQHLRRPLQGGELRPERAPPDGGRETRRGRYPEGLRGAGGGLDYLPTDPSLRPRTRPQRDHDRDGGCSASESSRSSGRGWEAASRFTPTTSRRR